MKNGKIKSFMFILYLFFFLFAPPLIPNVNIILPLSFITLIIIFFKYKKEYKLFIKEKVISKLYIYLLVYILYFTLVFLISYALGQGVYIENYYLNIYSFILSFPITFICSTYVVFKSRELNYTFEDLIKAFIKAGLIQGFIVILTLLIPEFKTFLVNLMYINTGDNLFNTPWIVERRFFGFSNSMLDLFGFGTGILTSLGLYYGLKVRNKFLLAVPILFLIPLMNSRSGIIIILIAIIVFIFHLFYKYPTKRVKITLISIVSVIVISIILSIINSISPNTIEWIKADLLSFINPTDASTNSTVSVLFSDNFWSVPDDYKFLIGSGNNISGYLNSSADLSSDIGYINEIWKVGMIGLLFIYGTLINFILKAKKIADSKHKVIFTFFIFVILVFSIKASIFTYNPGMAIIYTLSFYMIYNKKKDVES